MTFTLKIVNRHKLLLGDAFLLLRGIEDVEDVFSASGNVCGNIYAFKKLRCRMLGSILFYFFNFILSLLFFFLSFLFISWRLITLQYCSGFCHTLT